MKLFEDERRPTKRSEKETKEISEHIDNVAKELDQVNIIFEICGSEFLLVLESICFILMEKNKKFGIT